MKWFFRVGKGPRVRLPDKYSTDPSSDFMQAYNAAMEGRVIKTKPKSRYKKETLGWLFDVYQQSAKFADLAVGTRRARAYIIKGIVSNAGTSPLSDITPKVVRKGRERRAKTPEAANNFLKTMKAAFAWGVDSGLIDIDPTKDVKKLLTKTDGFHTWTPEEIEQFENRHPLGTMARLALDIMTYTGLRRQDASVIGRQHIKNGQIHFKASKNDEWVYLPIVPPLQKSIEASEAGDMTLLLTSRGKPFSSPASFGNWFRDRCVEAGVPGRAHGLRKAGAVLAAERGATVSQLKAVFGWTSDDMASLYTKRADRKKMGLETGGLLDRS